MKVRIYSREYRPDASFLDFEYVDEVEHSGDPQDGFYAAVESDDGQHRRVLWVNDDAVLAIVMDTETEAEE